MAHFDVIPHALRFTGSGQAVCLAAHGQGITLIGVHRNCQQGSSSTL